jgi:glyoxylase-like metal-dependent hydrolase (beta-lactamase superfamily II)
MLDYPPDSDVIEISIFGPGRGESIAVHLGDSRWIIVDSCRTSSKSIPVLSYLQHIGVDVAGDVKLIVATHPHADHFAGLAEIFRTCTSAKFVCAPAMMSGEFIALTDLQAEDHAGVPNRAYKEYRQVFELIESRETTDEDVLEFAFPQKHLFSGPSKLTGTLSLHDDFE